MKEHIIDYFLNNNYRKTNETYLKLKQPDIYNLIYNYTNEDLTFIEKLYLYLNDLKEPNNLCKICKDKKTGFLSLNEGYKNYCSTICTIKAKKSINKPIKVLINKDLHNKIINYYNGPYRIKDDKVWFPTINEYLNLKTFQPEIKKFEEKPIEEATYLDFYNF